MGQDALAFRHDRGDGRRSAHPLTRPCELVGVQRLISSSNHLHGVGEAVRIDRFGEVGPDADAPGEGA